MPLNSLRITGAQSELVSLEFDRYKELLRDGFGFLVLPLSNQVCLQTSSNNCYQASVGDMLILPGSIAGFLYKRKTSDDILCPDQAVHSKQPMRPDAGLEPDVNQSEKSVDAIVISVELCEIVKGGVGKTLPGCIHFKPLDETRNYLLTIASLLAQFPTPADEKHRARVSRLTELLLFEAFEIYLKKHPLHKHLFNGAGGRGISKALHAIHENPDTNWSVSNLAEIANMSRSRFAEKFKQTLNETPFNYIRQYRVHQAKLMLSDSSVPINNVAEKCGYASQSSFNKTFAAMTGLTPGEWRGIKGENSLYPAK